MAYRCPLQPDRSQAFRRRSSRLANSTVDDGSTFLSAPRLYGSRACVPVRPGVVNETRRIKPSIPAGEYAMLMRDEIDCAGRYLRKGRSCVKWNHGAQPTGLLEFPAPCRPALPFNRCKRLLRPRDRHRAASPACSGGDPVPGKDATLRHGLREPFPSASAAVP